MERTSLRPYHAVDWSEVNVTERRATVRSWQQTALHPLRVQLRHRGAPRRRRRPPLRAHPRRQGPPGVAGLHVREGAAARPLPERRGTGCCTRCAGAPDGTFEEIDWDTAIAEVAARLRPPSATPTAASRSSTTAAAGRGTTSAARYGGATLRALGAAVPVATRWPRRRPASSGSTARCSARTCAATSSTARSPCSSARTRGRATASRTPARR